ncbi:MAG TPA: hypothetical protein VLE43_16920, partial [Candidatus Saccharimonadia bacterium]|nr:hypothetical protein [Candidatus Saccharimonadia bacterium]
NLASLLISTDRLKDAEPLMRTAVEIAVKFRHSTGHEHPNFRLWLDNYRGLLEVMNLLPEKIEEKLRAVLDAVVGDAAPG